MKRVFINNQAHYVTEPWNGMFRPQANLFTYWFYTYHIMHFTLYRHEIEVIKPGTRRHRRYLHVYFEIMTK